jgi:hypothetical protein
VAISVPNESTATVTKRDSGAVIVDFANGTNGTGVAFKFHPPLDVRGFTHLQVIGTADESFRLHMVFKGF